MLLVLNPQNSYLSNSGSVYMGDKAEILKIRLLDYLSKYNGKKIFFREKHAMEDSFFSSSITHSVVTTEDFFIHDSLKKYADIIIDKTRFNAFYNTSLESILKKSNDNNVDIVGLETHTSVLFTVEELRNRGYSVSVIEPCVMSIDDYLHNAAISIMNHSLGVKII